MSVEKTVVYENEKWQVTQYFDVWTIKGKGAFAFENAGLKASLEYGEIIALKEILSEVEELYSLPVT